MHGDVLPPVAGCTRTCASADEQDARYACEGAASGVSVVHRREWLVVGRGREQGVGSESSGKRWWCKYRGDGLRWTRCNLWYGTGVRSGYSGRQEMMMIAYKEGRRE